MPTTQQTDIMNNNTLISLTFENRKFFVKIGFLILIISGMFYSCNLSMNKNDASGEMVARIDGKSGQAYIMDKDKPVLRYIYATVYEDDEFAFNGLDANEYVATAVDSFMTNPSIYAVPRSNYIHPVYGLNGEILTRDWAKDHPHHRGIYWAWPEVDFGSERGDLHALQKVFARPTGRIKVDNGKDFAQIEAENIWITERGVNTIVREISIIRAYQLTEHGRIIDLAFLFEGIKDSVTIARRGTDAYGGLNVRMMSPKGQEIAYHNDEEGQIPRRSWSDLSGVFAGNEGPSGMTIFQHNQNPHYPGDWVEYPDLSWVQPTFPSAGYRFELKPGEPLLLKYRILVYPGMRPDKQLLEQLWDDYHSGKYPEIKFTF
jgi:hypothetical protein